MLYLDQPLGGGAIILLLIVLAISIYIGVRHLSRVRTPKAFLIVDHKARGFDVLASQVAYYMSLAAGVALVPALAFDFGPIGIFGAIIYFISAIAAFLILLSSKQIQAYLSNNYGIAGFISIDFLTPEKKWIEASIGITMAIVYWGLFAIEIVVLKKIFEIVFPDAQSYTGVVILSIALCIVYAAMGGYLGTMRTDAFQTLFLCIILIVFTIITLPNDTLSILISSRLFLKWPTASWEDVIPFLISACLLGCAYLIVQQDAWSRVSSASRREGIKTISLNLSLSLLAIIPAAFVGLWGIYAYEKFSADVNSLGNDSVPGLLISSCCGKDFM